MPHPWLRDPANMVPPLRDLGAFAVMTAGRADSVRHKKLDMCYFPAGACKTNSCNCCPRSTVSRTSSSKSTYSSSA